MTTHLKNRVAVWIFGFLTIMTFLTVFTSAMMWVQYGESYVFTPFLIAPIIGGMPVTQYFWISITVGFVLLGCTVITTFRKENTMEVMDTMKAQERSLEKISEAYRTTLKSHESLETHIDDTFLKSQERLKEHIGKTMIPLSDVLSNQESLVKSVEQLNSTLDKTKTDLADLKKGIRSLEATFLSPSSKLTFGSSPEQIKGIGPRITKELEALGITTAGDFLFSDPAVIGDYTSLSRDQAKRLQGMTQLLMIPNIDEADIGLLQRVGVTNRMELATQDPGELNIKLLNAFADFTRDGKHAKVKNPDINRVLYWVRSAQS